MKTLMLTLLIMFLGLAISLMSVAVALMIGDLISMVKTYGKPKK